MTWRQPMFNVLLWLVSSPYPNRCVVHLSMNCCNDRTTFRFCSKQSFWNCVYSQPKAGSIVRRAAAVVISQSSLRQRPSNLCRIRFPISNSTNLRQDIAKWRGNLFTESHYRSCYSFVRIRSNSTLTRFMCPIFHKISATIIRCCHLAHLQILFERETRIMRNCVDSSV